MWEHRRRLLVPEWSPMASLVKRSFGHASDKKTFFPARRLVGLKIHHRIIVEHRFNDDLEDNTLKVKQRAGFHVSLICTAWV